MGKSFLREPYIHPEDFISQPRLSFIDNPKTGALKRDLDKDVTSFNIKKLL